MQLYYSAVPVVRNSEVVRYSGAAIVLRYTRSGARFACPTPCLVTIVDDGGFAIISKSLPRVVVLLRLLMCTLNPALKTVVKFKGALLSNLACIQFLIALVEFVQENFHRRSHAISALST